MRPEKGGAESRLQMAPRHVYASEEKQAKFQDRGAADPPLSNVIASLTMRIRLLAENQKTPACADCCQNSRPEAMRH